MNQGAELSAAERLAEIKRRGGLSPYREHALSSLRLKTVIKESHGRAITCLEGYHAHPCGYNLVASIASSQLTVYDGEHLGDSVSITAQYVHETTPHARGGDLAAVAWLQPGCLSRQPSQDIMLAVGSGEADVCIVSLAEGAVVRQLQGPEGSRVVDLATTPVMPNLLAALHNCGKLIVWDLQGESQVYKWTIPGSLSLAWTPTGDGLAVGGQRGKVWSISLKGKNEPQELSILAQLSWPATASIDCLEALPGDRIALKASDGRVAVLGWPSLDCLASWRIPGSVAPRSCFGTTPDGACLAMGNCEGRLYVHCTATGKRLANVDPVKAAESVVAVALSHDCRHLWAALAGGLLLRYQYLGQDATGDKENANGRHVPAAESSQY